MSNVLVSVEEPAATFLPLPSPAGQCIISQSQPPRLAISRDLLVLRFTGSLAPSECEYFTRHGKEFSAKRGRRIIARRHKGKKPPRSAPVVNVPLFGDEYPPLPAGFHGFRVEAQPRRQLPAHIACQPLQAAPHQPEYQYDQSSSSQEHPHAHITNQQPQFDPHQRPSPVPHQQPSPVPQHYQLPSPVPQHYQLPSSVPQHYQLPSPVPHQYDPSPSSQQDYHRKEGDDVGEITPLSAPVQPLPPPLPPRSQLRLTELHVQSAYDHLDVVDMFDFEQIPALLEQVLLQFEMRGDFGKKGYKALVRGRIPLPGYVLDSAGRIWHQLTTSLFVIRHTPPPRPCAKPLETEKFDDTRWAQLIALVLNSMLLSSAGARDSSYPSCNLAVRSIIVLQTIREMLHWRHVLHSLLNQLPPNTSCKLDVVGSFSVVDARLCYDESTAPDLRFLDPATWTSGRTTAQGLLAWTNVPVTIISDPLQLLKSVDVTRCNANEWARVALSFGASHNLDQSLAFVGLIRFLVTRHYVPAAGDSTLLCANEFLDRAVAVPELEACLPHNLGVQNTYKSGHDIDTGALTAIELLDTHRRNESMATAMRDIHSSFHAPYHPHQHLSIPSPVAGIGLRGLPLAKDRRVVMSVWTGPLTGSEWQVPLTVTSSVNLHHERAKYQLCTTEGQVMYMKVGMLKRLKSHVSRITQIQTPFLSLQREATHASGAEESGAVAISNALARAYGDEACLHMLSWLHRGIVTVSPECTVASFVPRSSHFSSIVVNQRLDYEIGRRMVFARKEHELYWLPGEGLPCFRVRDCSNGTYRVTETDGLPAGAELCKAEVAKDFG